VYRLGKVDEVANAVVMFVTCGYITGQSLLMYLCPFANCDLTLKSWGTEMTGRS